MAYEETRRAIENIGEQLSMVQRSLMAANSSGYFDDIDISDETMQLHALVGSLHGPVQNLLQKIKQQSDEAEEKLLDGGDNALQSRRQTNNFR